MSIDSLEQDDFDDEGSDDSGDTIFRVAILTGVMRACIPGGLTHHEHMSIPIDMRQEFMSIRVHTCVSSPDVLQRFFVTVEGGKPQALPCVG